MGSGNMVHIQKGEITERDMYTIASIVGISDKCNHTKRPKMKTGFLDAMLFLENKDYSYQVTVHL